MNLADLVQTFKLEEDLMDLLHDTSSDCEDNEYNKLMDVILTGSVEEQLDFLKRKGWTDKQIEAHLTDEELSPEEEMKIVTLY